MPHASDLVSMAEISANGLQSWQTTWRDGSTPVVSWSQTVFGTGGARTETSTAPDGSYIVSAYQNGRLASVTRYDGSPSHAQIGQTLYGYDPHGRQNALTDARNGTTTYTYNSADQVVTVTTPNPGTAGGSPQTTTTYYDTSLRAWKVTQPDGASVTNQFDLTGVLTNTSGARTYPVAYTYDYAGRMKTMTTWTNFAASQGAAVTTWNYHSQRGWLNNKRYADNTGPAYTYTAAGRLGTRAWARGVTTTYTYDTAGGLSTVGYSDSTPGVSYTYDRRGRQATVVRNGMTATFAYDNADELLTESYTGGTLAGLTVTSGYDQYLRRTSLTLLSSSSQLLSSTFGYDAASRLQTVTDGNGNQATYSYLANSPLVSQIVFANSGTTRMTTTKQYDFLNRLTQISSVPSVPSVVGFGYTYNAANQRVQAKLADASYWLYTYDSLGQVVSGSKYWADETPVAGEQFGYTFDNIGNRTSATAGGDQNGANLRSASYTANNLNEYTQRTVQGYVDVMGLGFATNSVTVNGQTAYRKREYFRQQLSVANSGNAVWQGITNAQSGQATVTGSLFVPQTPESFSYDSDGNLLTDGRWTYTWDAENRLVSMAANTAVGPQISLKFECDWQGRRIHKQVWPNTTWSGNPANDVIFVYDGWNLLAALSSPSSVLQSFLWGLDLSGSRQGAGGVGGLLETSYPGAQTTNCFAAFDGNGNLAAFIDAAGGTNSAVYEYGPFGEVIRATGPMAKANPLRFSTKFQDDESDLVYYGYRYYSASTGRWINRDPAEEDGGLNLYGFVRNQAISHVDAMGQSVVDDRNKLVYLHNCEIKIVYGHGSSSQAALRHWAWKYKDADCNGGAAVMCWPVNNMEGLTSNQLWTDWGGYPLEGGDGTSGGPLWVKVFWAGKPAPNWIGTISPIPNANAVLVKVGIDALARAIKICNTTKCGCKNVHIYYIEVDHHGHVMDPKKAYDGVPVMADVTVPCANSGARGGGAPCN